MCSSLTDSGLVALIEKCPRLQCVDVSYCKDLTNATVCAIAKSCPDLKAFSAVGCTRISDMGVKVCAAACRRMFVCVCVCVCVCVSFGGCAQHGRLNTGSVCGRISSVSHKSCVCVCVVHACVPKRRLVSWRSLHLHDSADFSCLHRFCCLVVALWLLVALSCRSVISFFSPITLPRPHLCSPIILCHVTGFSSKMRRCETEWMHLYLCEGVLLTKTMFCS